MLQADIIHRGPALLGGRRPALLGRMNMPRMLGMGDDSSDDDEGSSGSFLFNSNGPSGTASGNSSAANAIAITAGTAIGTLLKPTPGYPYSMNQPINPLTGQPYSYGATNCPVGQTLNPTTGQCIPAAGYPATGYPAGALPTTYGLPAATSYSAYLLPALVIGGGILVFMMMSK